MRFRLVPNSTTLDDLELIQVQMFTEFYSSHFLEATTAKRMKLDPYYQRQKCSPMILGSRNIRRMQIFVGFPWVGASNNSGVVDAGNFWRFGWLRLPLVTNRKSYMCLSLVLKSSTLDALELL